MGPLDARIASRADLAARIETLEGTIKTLILQSKGLINDKKDLLGDNETECGWDWPWDRGETND